jgi:hypothetical protein
MSPNLRSRHLPGATESHKKHPVRIADIQADSKPSILKYRGVITT